MNSNIVQMISRPPVNPNRAKNTQASYTNIQQQQVNNAARHSGTNIRDYQSRSFVEGNQLSQPMRNPPMRVNSDKKLPDSRTTHSQFSFHINQNLNTEVGMQNGSWSSGHNTGQFGAGSHTNSVGRHSSNANQTPYYKNEQFGLNQVKSPVMAQQYNTIPYNSETPSSLEDNEAQILASNWNSIHNRQPQSVTAQLKNIIGDRQAKLLRGKQSSSLNRQMAGFKGMDDGNAQKRNVGYAAQNKPKAGRFISGNTRKPQAQLTPSVLVDGAKQMNQKKLVGRVISHDGRVQKQGEQPPINIYAQLMEPSQPSQENEILVQMMQNKALNTSGDSSFNDIMNYPPEQLKTLLELRGGKQFADMYEEAMKTSNTSKMNNEYMSANSSNYNMPLQIKSQNFMMNAQGDGNKYSNQAAVLSQLRPQNLKAAQKELLNQYYRQKHLEESNLKEKEQQIIGIIHSIQQEQEMRNSNLSSFAQQTFQPGPSAATDKEPGLSFGPVPLDQRILFQDQGINPAEVELKYSKDENMKSLKSLYAKMNEDYHENKHQLKTRMDQMNKVIAETNREASSEDSDKKAENLIFLLKQEVEELKQQKGIMKQSSLKTLSQAQKDGEPPQIIQNAEDSNKHEQGVLQQNAAAKSWLRQDQAVAQVPAQQIQQERSLQIFDISQKNSANNRDRNTHRSKNEKNQEDSSKSKSLKAQDSAAIILQQQFGKPMRTSFEAKQNQQLPPPSEIMINTDYDNDQAMQQNEKEGQVLPTEKSVNEQHGSRKVRNKSNGSSQHDNSQGSGSQRSASQTYRPASSNLATMGQNAQNSQLMAPEFSAPMQEEFASNDNLNMPYSEGQSFVPKRKDGLLMNASNRYKRKNDNSAERSSKDVALSKGNSSSSLRLKSNRIEAKQFSGLTFNNNSRVEDEDSKVQQEKAGEAQSNDTLAQYLIGGQSTPNQNVEAKDGMTPDSVDSFSQNNRSQQEILKLLHNQNKSYKSSERNEMVSKTADAVMRNRVQGQESHQVGQENDQFTNLNINNNKSDIEKNSNQGQRIFQSSPLSSKKQLGDDSEQFNERLAALVANTDAQGRFSHELSYSRLNGKNEDNEFMIESSQHDNTLQLSGELMPQHIDRIVSQQQQSERNLLDSQEHESINEQIPKRQLRSGGPFNRQIGSNSNEVHLNGFENHIFQQFKDDSVKNLSVILNNEQQHQMVTNQPLQERGPLRPDQLQRSLQAQQKNINQLNLPLGHQEDDANNLFPTNIQSTQRQDVSGIQGTLNPDNTAINILQAENQQPMPVMANQQTENIFKLLLEDQRFLDLVNKAPTHDQNVQTELEKIQELAAEAECQTDQQFDALQRNLSPFETYDLIFIRDLVNNLNYDNEVLHDNAQDLKAAFMFLHHEHKQLQFKYQKELRNAKLVELYRERTQELMQERTAAMEKAMELRKKNELMNDIMKLAVEQNQLQEAETDKLLEQLAEENKQLRMMLGIHRENNDPSIIELGVKELSKLENEQLEKKVEGLSKMEDEHDLVEQEIHEGLLTFEQQMQRTQDDYLMILREEHDMQFNQDIDEHKEILQRIYDEKLNEKTEEIEQEIHAVLSKELTESISKDLKEKMADQMRKEVRAEVKDEVRDEVIDRVQKEERELAAEQLTEEITKKLRAQLQEEVRAQMEQEYEQRMKDELATRKDDAGDQIVESAERAADARNQMEQLKLLKQGSSLDSNEQTKNLVEYQQMLSTDQEEFKDTKGVFTSNELIGDQNEASDNENDRTQKLYQESDERQDREGDDGAEAYVAPLSSSLPLPRTSNSAQSVAAEALEKALAESPQRMPSGTDHSSSDNWSESDGTKRSDGQNGDSKGQGAGGTMNKYNFDNIVFESQHMSAEEQELFNQLQQRESVGQNDERADDQNLGSSLANEESQEEQASPQPSSERQPPEATRPGTLPSGETVDGGETRQSRNHHQFQGFQGQVLNSNINQYPNQGQPNGFESSPGQGLSRGSQFEGSNNVGISPNRQNRPVQQRQSQSSNVGRGQGFQGQTISGGGDVLAERLPQQQTTPASPRPVLLSNVPFELPQINRSPINHAAEVIDLNELRDDYKVIEGLENKQTTRTQLSADQMQSQTPGTTPSNAASASQPDPFGDQLEKETQKKDGSSQPRAMDFSPREQPIDFLLEDDMFQSDKSISPIKSNISPPQDGKRRPEGTSALDRTDGLRGMLIAMNEEDDDLDREEEKEEEYDYFLDPVQDEGGMNNKGYHLVDAADLETTDQKNDEVDPDEEEGLDNMLEGLKESIEQEEEDLQQQDRQAKLQK